MLEKIKTVIQKKFEITEKKWLFFSVFDKKSNMVFSKWILETDDNIQIQLDNFIKLLPNIILLKDIDIIICDVVLKIIEINNFNELLNVDSSKYWFILLSENNKDLWIILPNIEWVPNAKWALYSIKQKYKLDGKVKSYIFNTERFVIKI